MDLVKYLAVSMTLFLLGIWGIFLNRKNIIVMLMSIELMLLAVNLNLLIFSVYLDDLIGQMFALLVLTVAAAESAMAWSENEFLAEVQKRFGFRLGRFLQAGRRVPYPLSLTRALRTSATRCVIVGNAAQSLHPVAGMGFNLGLRDVATLAELVAEHAQEPGFDAGAPGLLEEYDAWRAADRAGVIAFTDGLVRMFSSPLHTLRRLRNLGLLAFDLLPPAKAALSRLSTGAAAGARVPKLARGVALR